MLEFIPHLLAMLALIGASAFFSGSEAALFYLRAAERLQMAQGGAAQRMAARLLEDPDRLLSAVLFWNLLVNISYFALASIVALRLEAEGWGNSTAAAFALASLMALIFFSEMLPKSVAVVRPRRIAALAALPMAAAVKMVAPLLPLLHGVTELSRRLVWPGFKPEPYLEAGDLERAIAASTSDDELVAQEQAMLRNIVALSEISVQEWMRPRTQFLTFRPPVSRDVLRGELTPSGYLFISEGEGEDVVSAIELLGVFDLPERHLERRAVPVAYLPWCATLADAVAALDERRRVAAIVNEYGETIGIVTFEDLLDAIFTWRPSRSRRLLNLNPIHLIEPGVWLVTGMTSVRRLKRELGAAIPAGKSVTVAGAIQESLRRLAAPGDEGTLGDLRFTVLEAPQRGHMLIRLVIVRERR